LDIDTRYQNIYDILDTDTRYQNIYDIWDTNTNIKPFMIETQIFKNWHVSIPLYNHVESKQSNKHRKKKEELRTFR
jgi:cytidylate kinase